MKNEIIVSRPLPHTIFFFNVIPVHIFCYYIPTDVPEPPSSPTIKPESPTTVELTWEPPPSDGGSEIEGYIVEKKDKFSPRWTEVTKEPIQDTAFKVRDLKEGEEAEFRVTAINKAGTSRPSEAAKLVFKVPDAPSRPEVSDVTPTSAVISWSSPESDGGSPITGYIVEKREKGKDRWVKVNRAPVKATTLIASDLYEGNEYEFRVKAENKAGLSEPSQPSKKVVARLPYGKQCYKNKFVIL